MISVDLETYTYVLLIEPGYININYLQQLCTIRDPGSWIHGQIDTIVLDSEKRSSQSSEIILILHDGEQVCTCKNIAF